MARRTPIPTTFHRVRLWMPAILLTVWIHLPLVAGAQNPLLDAIDPSAESSTGTPEGQDSTDPTQTIQDALAEARQRLSNLERTSGGADGRSPGQRSVAIELAARLVRVLEQRLEAQVLANDLNVGRMAIESGLARDPSELFGDPPPFPVPILDGVLQSWRRQSEQESKHQAVLDDHRANQRLANETVSEFEKDRRRLQDLLARERGEIPKLRLETELRALNDALRIAKHEAALADQRVANAEIEHDIKGIATRQARAALAWVEAHLSPRDTDLEDAIGGLDSDRLELDLEVDLARSRLVSAEGALRGAEGRAGAIDPKDAATYDLELTTRKRQLSHRQRVVALLNQRIERLGGMRTTWQRRYAVLGDRLELQDAPDWRAGAANELDRLTRLRRIHETELAQLQLELANQLRELTEVQSEVPGAVRWRKIELEDLEALVGLYPVDLATLDQAIALEDRLHAEVSARLEDRNLTERMQSYADNARSIWSFELTTSADRAITPGKVLIAISVFALGYLFARFMMRLLARRLFPRLGFDAGASGAFASLAFYGMLAVAFLFALRAVNIPLTAFAVVGGALALGIGFGSQAVVSNFISGLLLLAERPIRTGDLVEVGGVIGTVDTIGLRSTRIRTADNFHIFVPNSSFLETNVINWTHEDPRMRLRIAVGVAYGSSTRLVERLLIEAATAHTRSLDQPPPATYFTDFADSALLFEIRFWIRYDERTDRSAILSEIRFHIDELFAENGVVIAFPQIDVHLDGPSSEA